MNASTWQRLKPLLAEAALLPAGEQERFLGERCADENLRRQALELISCPAPITAIVAASLPAGTHLGPYVLGSSIGRGGMGEVYRAHDSRLGRNVAIKVLPPVFAADADRLNRFSREARLLAALNHPHICTLHDVGSQDGIDFLVMEYVEGQSLADRLESGPLPLQPAIQYAVEIADALAQAHANGVVHRDLKPGNVMLGKSGAKLLDFGLARTEIPAALQSTPLASQTACVQQRADTAAGTIVGTWQYMAPEQIEGGQTDGRTDIWAFGCLLFEMLTGRPAFDGRTRASLIAAIVERDPLSTLRAPLPASIEHVISQCVAKAPEDRWQSARDLHHELKWCADHLTPGTPATTGRPTPGTWFAWTAAAALILGGLAIASVVRTPRPPKLSPMRFSIDVPRAAGRPKLMALSPDGRTLAFEGRLSGSDRGSIWIRAIDSASSRPIKGTDGTRQLPFWSPDSRSIGFFADGCLKTVEVETGVIQTLADAPSGRGGSWNGDDTIIFAPAMDSGLFSIRARGGTAVPLTTLDAGDASHRLPAFVDDQHFVFTVFRNDGRTAIRIGRFGSSATAELISPTTSSDSLGDPTQATAIGGYLVFAQGGSIYAQPLNADGNRVAGERRLIAPQVAFDDVGRQAYTASNGLLIYQREDPELGMRQLTWVPRSGSPPASVWNSMKIGDAVLAPDGQHVAASIIGDRRTSTDVWVIDTARGVGSQITHSGHADSPVWSADGKWLYYRDSKGLAVGDLYARRADGTGREELLLDTPRAIKTPVGVDAAGHVLYVSPQPSGVYGLWSFDPSTHRASLVSENKGDPQVADVAVSRDGRLLAYSLRSGAAREVYVERLPSGPRIQVSTSGGQWVSWRADAKEVYYVANGKLMAAELHDLESLDVGAPRELFDVQSDAEFFGSSDGQRFLITRTTTSDPSTPPTAIVNWLATLDQGR